MTITLSHNQYTITDKPSLFSSFIVWLLFAPRPQNTTRCTFSAIRIAAVVLAVGLAVVLADLGQVLARLGFLFLQLVFEPLLGGILY